MKANTETSKIKNYKSNMHIIFKTIDYKQKGSLCDTSLLKFWI